jgi:predicted phosphodiesterase
MCGHIHKAEDRVIGGVRYLNSGDWVESLTAIVEEMDGSVRVVDRAELQARIVAAQEQAAQEQATLAVA